MLRWRNTAESKKLSLKGPRSLELYVWLMRRSTALARQRKKAASQSPPTKGLFLIGLKIGRKLGAKHERSNHHPYGGAPPRRCRFRERQMRDPATVEVEVMAVVKA